MTGHEQAYDLKAMMLRMNDRLPDDRDVSG